MKVVLKESEQDNPYGFSYKDTVITDKFGNFWTMDTWVNGLSDPYDSFEDAEVSMLQAMEDSGLPESDVTDLEDYAFEFTTYAARVVPNYIVGYETEGDASNFKNRVHSFAFDFVITDDDLTSVEEARDRILRDIELVDGIQIVGNPNTDPTSWSREEYGLTESTKKLIKEDVDGFTFKDLLGKDFDEALKLAVQKIIKVPSKYAGVFGETVAEVLEGGGSDPNLICEMEAEAEGGDTIEYVIPSIVVSILDKNLNLEEFNNLCKKLGIETENEKNLKESESSHLCKFFKFDDVLDYSYDDYDDYDDDGYFESYDGDEPELKQIDGVTDWLQELIDCGYLDDLYGVWFEDCEGTAAAAGIPVKSMSEILAEDPDAKFGYSYGSPDTRLWVSNAVDYVKEVDYDDDDYDDED